MRRAPLSSRCLIALSILLTGLVASPPSGHGDEPNETPSAPTTRRGGTAARPAAQESPSLASRRAAQQRARRRNRDGSTNTPIPGARYVDPVSPAGQRARGFYVTGAFAELKGPRGIASWAKRMGLDAVVIDMKDGAGRVTYPTRIPELRESIVSYLDDPAEYVRAVKAEGVYTIARIVCFADPKLPRRLPDRAITHAIRGTPWVSHGTGGTWLDPYDTRNHDMVVALAKEAASFGFDELQLDYIRFPVDPGIKYANYPAEREELRSQVLLSMMRRIDEEVSIPLGVDVFGLTAFDFGDPEVLGQFLHEWTGHVEVFTPMIYLHAMRAWSRNAENRSQTLVQTGLSQMRSRMGPVPVIRPFLQSFDRRTSGRYDPTFIADQIRGARLADADGFLFWHPGSNYSMLFRGMTGPARSLHPFPLAARADARTAAWDEARARR